MDLNDLNIPSPTAPKLLNPAPPDAEEGWRGRVIYLYDARTKTTIRKVCGRADNHLGAVED